MSRSDFTDKLFGFTFLFSLEFSSEPDTGFCKLVMHLAKDDSYDAQAIRAEYFNVSNLCISNLGGGLTQLEFLLIEDIADQQLDRINYQVREVERESLSFLCQRITVTEVGGSA
jgi:hypothetical protein